MFEERDRESLFISDEADELFMREALLLAEKAKAEDEVPVGAIVVHRGEIIARAYNRREGDRCATHHAELLAIEEACRVLGGWRLPNCTLYVTLEPCPMCAGAIMNSRIDRVVFGAPDNRAGAFGTLVDLNALPLNHKTEIKRGVLSEECAEILRTYFREKREK
jgi:tRNA(adenine34) deaminase